jgi:hypothetical protein
VELRQLAGTPLFLLLLVGLRLSGVPLPTRRFEVYESVVQQLLKDHPATRATAAGMTSDHNVLPADDVRQVLAHVAYLQQLRGDLGPVPETAVRADLLEALKDPGHLAMDAQSAARTVRPFVEIAEGRLAVLWRNKRPGEVSQLVQVIADQAQDDRPAALTVVSCWPRRSSAATGCPPQTRRGTRAPSSTPSRRILTWRTGGGC